MAEEEIDDKELQKAIKLNGRFVDPWKTTALPSLIDFLRWRLKEKSERGVRGTWKDLYRLRKEASILHIDQRKCILATLGFVIKKSRRIK